MGLDESTESHSISSSNRRTGGLLSCDSRTLVIWLEDYDDMNYIPTDLLSTESTTGEEPLQDPSIIFIHSLRNGLFRVTVRTSHNVKGHPSPLVSGSVVSRRALGALLRETIVNHGNRRRLDSDAHTHPNHRRSRKIQEIKERFQDNQNDHRFYSQIIQDISTKVSDLAYNTRPNSYSSTAVDLKHFRKHLNLNPLIYIYKCNSKFLVQYFPFISYLSLFRRFFIQLPLGHLPYQ